MEVRKPDSAKLLLVVGLVVFGLGLVYLLANSPLNDRGLVNKTDDHADDSVSAAAERGFYALLSAPSSGWSRGESQFMRSEMSELAVATSTVEISPECFTNPTVAKIQPNEFVTLVNLGQEEIMISLEGDRHYLLDPGGTNAISPDDFRDDVAVYGCLSGVPLSAMVDLPPAGPGAGVILVEDDN